MYAWRQPIKDKPGRVCTQALCHAPERATWPPPWQCVDPKVACYHYHLVVCRCKRRLGWLRAVVPSTLLVSTHALVQSGRKMKEESETSRARCSFARLHPSPIRVLLFLKCPELPRPRLQPKRYSKIILTKISPTFHPTVRDRFHQ